MVVYDRIVAGQALSENAGLAAALMSLLPEHLRDLAPADQARWIGDSITWLSRGLDHDSGTFSTAV